MNALSFDVEEYYHVHAFAGAIDPARWDEYPSRVAESTRRVLSLLGDVKATFFVLGDVARRNPELIREIAAAGHEIASHGDRHQRVDLQAPLEFRIDIRTAKRRIEDIVGQRVIAYRAPSFSITTATPWAHVILIEEGYTLDSSMAAGRRGRSLEPTQSGPHTIATPAGSLIEFPLPAIAGLPIGGGGYLRLFPYWLSKRALEKLTSPFCVYLHPWEFDVGQPRLMAPMIQNFRHRIGLHTTEGKLRSLLAHFSFSSIQEIVTGTGVQRLAA